MGRLLLKAGALFLCIIVLTSCAGGGRLRNGDFKRVADGREITFGALLEELRPQKLIFVGEIHDNAWHHEIQLAVIRELSNRGVPLAIGLEMFSSDSQPALDAWVEGTLDLQDFMDVYRKNWTIPWVQYDTILLFARKHRIPLVALNVPRDIAQKVNRTGFASLTAEEKRNLPPGVTCRIDTPYMHFVRSMYAEHTTAVSFEHFCEAQSVRNQTMAWLAVNYIRRNPRRSMVVLTGVGHAIKRGVPLEVDEYAKLRYSVIIPPLSPYAMSTIRSDDADYLMTDD